MIFRILSKGIIIAPKKDDLLLAKNGTTGVAAIVDRDEVFDIYVSLALLRPIGINSVYLWGAVNAQETKEQFDSSLKGIGVPNLHLGEIKKTKIIVPPDDKQREFALFVAQVNKSKVIIRKENREDEDLLKKYGLGSWVYKPYDLISIIKEFELAQNETGDDELKAYLKIIIKQQLFILSELKHSNGDC